MTELNFISVGLTGYGHYPYYSKAEFLVYIAREGDMEYRVVSYDNELGYIWEVLKNGKKVYRSLRDFTGKLSFNEARKQVLEYRATGKKATSPWTYSSKK